MVRAQQAFALVRQRPAWASASNFPCHSRRFLDTTSSNHHFNTAPCSPPCFSPPLVARRQMTARACAPGRGDTHMAALLET
jgi:hypothetical protein